MAYVGKYKLPYKIVDGIKHFVSIEEWATTTLDPTNLALFETAKAREDALWQSAASNGNVTISSLDVNGQAIVMPPQRDSVPWPQVWTVTINNNPSKTGLFNSDFTSNLPKLSPQEKAGTHTIVNHTMGSTYQHFFDSNGNFVSMTTPVMINPVNIPPAAASEITWDSEPFQQDPEFVKFSEQYRNDPSLTWDPDSEQLSNT